MERWLARGAAVLLVLAVSFGVITAGGPAMAKEIVLFSAVDGRLVHADGSPATGVRISRNWRRGSREAGDEATTDGTGRFAFPEIAETPGFFASLLPGSEPTVQRMTAHAESGDVLLWQAIKNSPERHAELEGKPTKIVCRVDAEPGDGGLYWGTCVADQD
ncbi:MAG: DUF6795 domain-containing protein [Pseudomonadota bacterium]